MDSLDYSRTPVYLNSPYSLCGISERWFLTKCFGREATRLVLSTSLFTNGNYRSPEVETLSCQMWAWKNPSFANIVRLIWDILPVHMHWSHPLLSDQFIVLILFFNMLCFCENNHIGNLINIGFADSYKCWIHTHLYDYWQHLNLIGVVLSHEHYFLKGFS